MPENQSVGFPSDDPADDSENMKSGRNVHPPSQMNAPAWPQNASLFVKGEDIHEFGGLGVAGQRGVKNLSDTTDYADYSGSAQGTAAAAVPVVAVPPITEAAPESVILGSDVPGRAKPDNSLGRNK